MARITKGDKLCTYWLGRIRVCRTIFPYGVSVITKRVNFISLQIEGLRPLPGISHQNASLVFGLMALVHICLLWKFFGVKCRARLVFEMSKLGTKGNHHIIHNCQRQVSVKMELG